MNMTNSNPNNLVFTPNPGDEDDYDYEDDVEDALTGGSQD